MYPYHYFLRTLLALLAVLSWGMAHAALQTFEGYAAASDEELDKMRGGFELNFNGMQLMLAFSLEQLTYVNGELVSSMKFNPIQLTLPATPTSPTPETVVAATPVSPSGSSVTSPPVPPVPAVPATPSQAIPPPTVATQVLNNQGVITLVQNGSGNTFTLPQSLSSLTTVIQNTVNDQVIRNLTVLNATLSLQAASASMRLGTALNQAIAASVPH